MGGYDIDVGECGYDAEKGLKKVICFDTLMGLQYAMKIMAIQLKLISR
jgi:hypothetical protein